jgi:hypothetical protein
MFMPLLLGLTVFAAISFYLGFVSRNQLLSGKSQAAFFVCAFILIPATMFNVWQRNTTINKIANSIPLYPNAEQILHIPKANTSDKGNWLLLETKDSVDQIMHFYQLSENHQGWEITKTHPTLLRFEKTGFELNLTITEGQQMRSILYKLEERAPWNAAGDR